MLFDSHCHLHFPQYDSDRGEIIKKLRDFEIRAITVGTDLKDSEKALRLANEYPDLIWASAGIHPHEAENSTVDWEEFEKIADSEQVVAIGECGLDYAFFNRKPPAGGGLSVDEIKKKQKQLFIKQVDLAEKLNKPLIIHCRPSSKTADAYEDTLEILKSKNLNFPNGNGAIHFFSGTKEIARKFLDLGFFIGFAGPITFTGEYREAVESVPLGRILAETDSPFACPTLPAGKFAGGRAAPIPRRGKRNEPDFVEFVVRRIAEWKNTDFETVACQTFENAKNLFKI